MALIGKIRERSWILIVVVGIGLLAFILPNTGGGGQVSINPGKVYGEDVSPQEYQAQQNEVMNYDMQQAQSQNRPYSAEDRDNSIEKAWQQLITQKVLGKEIEALQISVSDQEAEAKLLGVNGFKLDPSIEQQFIDSTGKFNRAALENQIDKLKSSTNPQDVQNWKNIIESNKKQRYYEKYTDLLKLVPYVTTLEAENEYVAQNEIKDVSFVGKSFADIPDEEVNITDAEIKKYYDTHKTDKKWEVVAANRSINYFSIPINPSESDINQFNKEMEALKAKFQTTKNDSLFVLMNSDFKYYSSGHLLTYMPQGNPKAQQGLTYPMAMDSIFKHATVGEIVGPYQNNGVTVLAKVIGFNKYELTARHILLNAADSASIAKQTKLADSLMKIINTNNFEEYVTKYSGDQGSVHNGGKYEDFMDFTMVPEFGKFVYDNPVGKIGYVKTQYGIHIIEVLGKKEVDYPVLATVQKTLVPSEATDNAIRNDAYDMIDKIDSKLSKITDPSKKLERFDSIAKENNFFVAAPLTIYDNNPKINVFKNPNAKNSLIKLSYKEDATVGYISSTPIRDDNQFIVAIVSGIQEKGVPNYESIKEMMKREAIKEKKAKRITSMLLHAKDLNTVAKKLGTEVNQASVTFANPQLGNAGFEPKIVGALFNKMKDGQTTSPLEGNNGVYMVKINKTTKAAKTKDYEVQRQQLLGNMQQVVGNQVIQALTKIADPVDLRTFNELGIAR